MERNFTNLNKDIDPSLGIDPETIKLMSFQGEMSRVFECKSNIHGNLIIKTALTDSGISQTGIDEIKRNLVGYEFIPKKFRPEIIQVNTENSVMIMKNAGIPIRDVFWNNQNNLEVCKTIAQSFQSNIGELFQMTRNESASAECKTYTDRLVSKGISFLTSDFFPEELRAGFLKISSKVESMNESVGAFANMDATQGNLLIDISTQPQTLRLIDPKGPRITNGSANFTGIPEIDMGMFFITVRLNSPEVFQNLNFEQMLIEAGATLHSDIDKVKLYFDTGKVFGCILIASFPNTKERVEAYFKPFGITLSGERLNDVLNERQRHIDLAHEIVNKY